jgi:hypothetical protein
LRALPSKDAATPRTRSSQRDGDAWNRLAKVQRAWQDPGGVQARSTVGTLQYDGLTAWRKIPRNRHSESPDEVGGEESRRGRPSCHENNGTTTARSLDLLRSLGMTSFFSGLLGRRVVKKVENSGDWDAECRYYYDGQPMVEVRRYFDAVSAFRGDCDHECPIVRHCSKLSTLSRRLTLTTGSLGNWSN